jgi:ubiquinone/menaquinone biosynthesis C-methylase UbiE
MTYAGPPALRDSAELFSAVEQDLKAGARLLDLGCGPRDQYVAADHYGLRYVGVDQQSAAADILADAHALPFQAGMFEAVLAYAVFEHLYNPFLAGAEVARVLSPGGVFFGAVSQGEPYHDSFFHHTALGLLTVLKASGLEPVRLWFSYDTLHALAVMGRYATAVRWLIEGVHRIHATLPFLAPRKHFRWSESEKQVDALHRAASICFVARKPGGSAIGV